MIHPCKQQTNAPSPTKLLIRNMVEQDIPHFCTLFQDVFSRDPWNEQWSIAVINKLITSQMRKKEFAGFTALTISSTIGYCTGYSLPVLRSIFYIDQLFIDTQYQGQKTGSRLFAESIENLANTGITIFFLLTKPGSIAENFYRNNGFKPLFPLFRIRGKSLFFKSIKKKA